MYLIYLISIEYLDVIRDYNKSLLDFGPDSHSI